MPLPDKPETALDYEAEVRPDGVIDIPGEEPAPRGPGLSKGLALILLGLLIAGTGWLYGGLAAWALLPIGAVVAVWTLLLMLGLPRLRRRQSTGIRTSLRRRGPGMKGEL